MTDPKPRDEGTSNPAGGSFIEEKVVPLIREPTLGPVWLVLIAHVAAFGAWALLLAVEERRFFAMLGALGLFWLTGTLAWTEIRERRRPGALSALVAITWAMTIAFALGARKWGLF